MKRHAHYPHYMEEVDDGEYIYYEEYKAFRLKALNVLSWRGDLNPHYEELLRELLIELKEE